MSGRTNYLFVIPGVPEPVALIDARWNDRRTIDAARILPHGGSIRCSISSGSAK